MTRLAMSALLLPICLYAPAAWAQMDSREGIALQNQILEMRRDIQALRNEQGRGGPPAPIGRVPPSSGSGEITTQLLERVDRLEDSVRQLNGRLDEMDNARQRQGADLAKQIGDLQFRLDNGAGGSSVRPPPPAGPAPVPLGTLPLGSNPPAPVRRTPELALQEGNAALARRDYAGAEASAREVLANSKASPRGYDAQFLLAQALVGQRNFGQAAVAFGDTYDRNKQGGHAEDSLLGLANSLLAINEKRSACVALDSLRSQFPQSRPDVVSRATALRASAGCR